MSVRQIIPAFVLIALMTIGGCGGSLPTQPTGSSVTNGTPAPAPPAGGDNPSPAPAPAPPPIPAPPPTPGPAPVPEPGVQRWTATVTSAHWVNAAALPDTFEVELRGQIVRFGTLPQLPVIARTDTAFAAGHPGTVLEAHLESTGWVWSYQGVEGQAAGTMRQ